MRWSLLIAVIGLSSTDVASFAQGRPDGQRPATTRSTSEDAGFFASKGVVRFQLIQGRLCLDAPRHRKGSQNRDEGQVYESITVTAERGIPSMHYVYQSPQHHLALSVQRATAMRLESWAPESGERSTLDQPTLGEIVWTHQRGDLVDTHRGPTLLHLRGADPMNFDRHFGAMFQRLLRGQTMQELCSNTTTAMLTQLTGNAAPEIANIERAVRQLRSSKRTRRVAAERQLLDWGTPIIPVIQSIPAGDLDREQQERLTHIFARIRPRENDSACSLARLLVNDQAYWQLIAEQLNENQLRVANSHLQRVGLSAIERITQPSERIASARD